MQARTGSFARTHLGAGAPGLPRGRSRLPRDVAQAAHRDRLIRAVVSAVHDLGYGAVTITDIVQRARVSKAVFYEHFPNKKECLLAAARLGAEVTFEDMVEKTQARLASRDEPADPFSMEVIATGMRSYLELIAGEPEFARVYYLELPALGEDGFRLQDEAASWFADMTREWHRRAVAHGAPWPDLPDEAFVLLVDAVTSRVGREVREGRAADLKDAEQLMLDLYSSVLFGRAWPPRSEGDSHS